MSKISKLTLEAPPSLGFVDPNILEQMQQKFPTRLGEEGTPMGITKNRGQQSEEFLELVNPIAQALTDYVLGKHGAMPAQIKYSYSTLPVPPQHSQRGFVKWHLDGMPEDTEFLLVSSAPDLTTEMLVADGSSVGSKVARGLFRASLIAATDDMRQSMISSAISAGTAHIHKPEPYEMIISTDRLHRPSVNNTELTIPRGFLRAIAVL